MSLIDAEGGLGINLGFTQWQPMYFSSMKEAYATLKSIKKLHSFELYTSPDGKEIYESSNVQKNAPEKYVIFIKKLGEE